MSLFITTEDLKDLTGAHTRAGNIQWLRQRGWPFEVNRHGWPRVLLSHLECRLGAQGTEQQVDSFEPNWSALGAK